MFENEITVDLDNQTYGEEKTKRISKVLCGDKMLENLGKGREKRKQLPEDNKTKKELENLYKGKRRIK